MPQDGADEGGVAHGPLYETEQPLPFALVVLRDPDGIQLELI